jgi:hypothetical protein
MGSPQILTSPLLDFRLEILTSPLLDFRLEILTSPLLDFRLEILTSPLLDFRLEILTSPLLDFRLEILTRFRSLITPSSTVKAGSPKHRCPTLSQLLPSALQALWAVGCSVCGRR